MHILFINRTRGSARIPRAEILRVARRAEKIFAGKVKAKEVSVVFVLPKDSKALNLRYRGKPRPTNVLSFRGTDKGTLGDIIICPQVAAAEALSIKVTRTAWIAALFAHGLLHLLGYDHQTKGEEDRMEKAAAKLCQL